ncbi:hypothetical protein H70357_10445 [Paenibacillus sp. FSL H7-0357]|nr:hypothetical protein H70357_10445 [Paenibacillus sp. FSL H7-0357]
MLAAGRYLFGSPAVSQRGKKAGYAAVRPAFFPAVFYTLPKERFPGPQQMDLAITPLGAA